MAITDPQSEVTKLAKLLVGRHSMHETQPMKTRVATPTFSNILPTGEKTKDLNILVALTVKKLLLRIKMMMAMMMRFQIGGLAFVVSCGNHWQSKFVPLPYSTHANNE